MEITLSRNEARPLAVIAGQKGLRNELEALHITSKHVQATDSYSLLRVPREFQDDDASQDPVTLKFHKNGKPTKLPKGVQRVLVNGDIARTFDAKHNEKTPITVQECTDSYPDTSGIVDAAVNKEPLVRVKVNAQYLARLLLAFERDIVTLSITGERDAIVVTSSGDALGLLMSIQQ